MMQRQRWYLVDDLAQKYKPKREKAATKWQGFALACVVAGFVVEWWLAARFFPESERAQKLTEAFGGAVTMIGYQIYVASVFYLMGFRRAWCDAYEGAAAEVLTHPGGGWIDTGTFIAGICEAARDAGDDAVKLAHRKDRIEAFCTSIGMIAVPGAKVRLEWPVDRDALPPPPPGDAILEAKAAALPTEEPKGSTTA